MAERLVPYVAVVGSGTPDPQLDELAEDVGARLAQAGAVVICGGRGGVMEAACRGATGADGTAVGILPGSDRSEANPHVSVAIATGLGEARNVLVVRAADVVIAVGGGYGTLSEIAFALKTGTPVVGLRTVDVPSEDGDPLIQATSAAQAVDAALEALPERPARPPSGA